MSRLCSLSIACIAMCINIVAIGSESAERVLEIIAYDADGETFTLEGAVLVEAQDGLLVVDRFGELRTILSDADVSRTISDEPYQPAGADELAESLNHVMGGAGTIVITEHYVLCTTGSREFAEWAGVVLDQFHHAALEAWTDLGLEPHEPLGPLPILILASREEYVAFATRDASATVAQTRAYYSMRTNRMVLHDPLAESIAPQEELGPREVDRRMAALPHSIATLLHEATHQLAYNCGLHRRYADNPMWLTEGLAMCVEPSDVSRYSVELRLTRPNAERLVDFKTYVRQRRQDGTLANLLGSEETFRDANTQIDAYCESWALSWYLYREHRDEYVAYLRMVANKPLLTWDEPAQRLADFEAVFGDIADLEREFLRWMSRR